jgi:undecaprenyl-diphosphatase
MIDSLINKDIELLIYLNNLGSIQWDGFWLILTNKFSAVPLYLVLLYFTFKQFGFKKTMISLIFIALLITVSDQTSNLFKYGFKRLRPCHDESVVHLLRSVQERCGGLYGYFSAHAANSMAIAVFFSFILKMKYKIFTVILIVWALLVAYSRVYIGVHYPLDITTGILFGLLYGTLFSMLLKVFSKKFIH